MTAVGVAAVAAPKMVGRGKDNVWAFIVEVFGVKLARCGDRGLFYRLSFGCGMGGIWHY
jgi:hypothetical protein